MTHEPTDSARKPTEFDLAIAAEEARVSRLESELVEARTRLADLRENRSGQQQPPKIDSGISSRSSAAEKIALFRGLFRGRSDVYPRFWNNAKLGRSGYAPASVGRSAGENVSRTYLPVTDRVIEDHLRGRHIIGLYPLLADDTCWLLAADFDGESWQDDVGAFVATCKGFGLSPGVERSRSGKGAHAWFFFSERIPARVARTVGCCLITETMVRRYQLKLSSYDRLFPNQDTLPKGGFGNLIALPLQRAAAAEGNTVFLDDACEPRPDQWSYLAALQRSSLAEFERIARAAESTGRTFGMTPTSDSRQRSKAVLELPLTVTRRRGTSNDETAPTTVSAVLGQRVVVSLDGLPSALISQIRNLATFQNPEFYAKQRMRLSTHATPRIISCADIHEESLSLPRGCLEDLKSFLKSHGIALDVEERRVLGAEADISFLGTLNDGQAQAVEAMAAADMGVLVAPPGSGKTVMAIALMARHRRSVLVLVHRRPLLDQWVSRIEVFTGRARREIGQVVSGKRTVTGIIDVATVQSLTRKGVVDEIVSSYGTVIVDECHHVAAFSIEQILSRVGARYIVGLTATPRRRDGLEPIVHMQLGPVRHVMATGAEADSARLSNRLIVRETPFNADADDSRIQDLYAALGASSVRNDLLFNDVLVALEAGRSPIILTERRDHLDYLAARLRPFTRNLVVLHGGAGAKRRQETERRLAEISPGEERLVLATGRYIGEGFDDARLDTLFLAMPVAWRGTLVQYAGRLLRAHAGKREVQIYDYVDRTVPVLARMFDKRMRGYRAMGYRIPT